jgi:hypothetical protein
MPAYIRIFLIWCLLLCIADAKAQRKIACDSILQRAHNRLGSLYARAANSEGYSFKITVSATYSDKTIEKIKPQVYRMAVAGGMLLFESENVDSFQDDSVRISVIKTQNRIYIADSDRNAAAISYMDQFNALQKILPRFISVQDCKQVHGKVYLTSTINADTLGLDQVKSMTYVINKKNNDIHQIDFDFIDSSPITNYSISFSEIVKPYVIPGEIISKYVGIAHRSAAGLKQFEQYSVIDNRKKNNP